jgi:hypothetical protein
VQCIASTTTDEYRLHFEKDKALARRFQPVWIDEPSEVALYIHVYIVLSYSVYSFLTVASVEKNLLFLKYKTLTTVLSIIPLTIYCKERNRWNEIINN